MVAVFSFAQNPKADSLLGIIQKTGNDSLRHDARLKYAELLRHNYVQVKDVLREGMQEAKKAHDYHFLIPYHNASAIMYAQIGRNDSSIYYFETALNYAIYTKDTTGIASSYLGLSNIYRITGDLNASIRYALEAEKAALALCDSVRLARIYNSLGLVFKMQGDYPKALMYYSRAIDESLKAGDEVMLSGLYSNIGSAYQEDSEFDSALVYHRKALEIRLRQGDQMGLGISYGNFGLIFIEENEMDSALHYTNLALDKFKLFDYHAGIGMCHFSLGKIWKAQGEHKKAIESFRTAEAYIRSGNFLPDLLDILKGMAESYEALGRYKESTACLNEYLLYKDSLFSDERSKEVQKMQVEFEYKQRHLQDSLARVEAEKIRNLEDEKQRQINEQRLARQKMYSYTGVGGFGLVLIIAFILFRSNKKQKEYNAIIASQKAEVEEKNKEITDSITYAKRIQEAILPPAVFVNRYLPDHFIFYQPKDIVAGDFYWLEPAAPDQDGFVFVAAADCTGHGVPGAMVSVVCSNALNRAVKEFRILDTGQILDKVRELVIETFEKSETDVKDGMDISLVSLKRHGDRTLIQFSGANNPLWIVRASGELIHLKGDSQPIGKYANAQPFRTQAIQVEKGDSLYLFTDGFQDQFGGAKGKKFKASNLQKLLLSVNHHDMVVRRRIVEEHFRDWKGGLEQLDDVCLIGIRV